ncbi:MAG: hypothetical protein BRC58_05675, partial [Cyanobacteria bacterium QS_8_64_29]
DERRADMHQAFLKLGCALILYQPPAEVLLGVLSHRPPGVGCPTGSGRSARLEARIPQLEAEQAELEQAIAATPAEQYERIRELSEQLDALSQQIERETERWLELAELAS